MKQKILLSAVLVWAVMNGFAQIGQAGQKVVTGSQFVKVGRTMSLYHADPEQGRWHFASEAMLSRLTLGHYRKSSLRLMRNEILARHGYKFTTKDLVAYFTSQPWYHPAESNDHVQLSFYEQMTVALIQAEERKPDNQRSPIEEDPIWK